MKLSFLFTTLTAIHTTYTCAFSFRRHQHQLPLEGAALEQAALAEEALKEYENSMKYFHEPGSDDLLGHYDLRFFQKLLSYEEKRDTQVHMMRAYLEVFRENGLETWIAHGTLLGWWWNGKMLPWDWDIDTQVSEATLIQMGAHFNHTRHTYTASSSTLHNDPVTRTYLLDVNPHAAEREHGDGFNIIDARWIDVHNGLYIDITGLSDLYSELLPNVLSCKNFHHYAVNDIYPLRQTTYEGMTAQVPYAYDRILVEEYGEESLVLTKFEGYVSSAKRSLVVHEALTEV
jgi:hypothetical protein